MNKEKNIRRVFAFSSTVLIVAAISISAWIYFSPLTRSNPGISDVLIGGKSSSSAPSSAALPGAGLLLLGAFFGSCVVLATSNLTKANKKNAFFNEENSLLLKLRRDNKELTLIKEDFEQENCKLLEKKEMQKIELKKYEDVVNNMLASEELMRKSNESLKKRVEELQVELNKSMPKKKVNKKETMAVFEQVDNREAVKQLINEVDELISIKEIAPKKRRASGKSKKIGMVAKRKAAKKRKNTEKVI